MGDEMKQCEPMYPCDCRRAPSTPRLLREQREIAKLNTFDEAARKRRDAARKDLETALGLLREQREIAKLNTFDEAARKRIRANAEARDALLAAHPLKPSGT